MIQRKTFQVAFFCKKTKTNKKGLAPIYARITTSGISTEIYTQCQIEPAKWNQKAERSLCRDKVSLQINEILTNFRVNILTPEYQNICVSVLQCVCGTFLCCYNDNRFGNISGKNRFWLMPVTVIPFAENYAGL